jgi:hypothetical protein
MAEQMILGDYEDSENPLKRRSCNKLSAAQRRGGREAEWYAPDETWGCMENASLNTGANCKSTYALFYIM